MNDGTPIDPRAPVVVNNVLYNADAIVAAYMNDVFGLDITTVTYVALGIVDPNSESASIRDRLIAGCYFYNHVDLPGKRDISVAAVMTDQAATNRAAIRQILAYPFRELQLPRISAEIDMTNTRSLRQAEILGFQLEGIKKRMGQNGGDWGVFGLYPETCPFWKDEA